VPGVNAAARADLRLLRLVRSAARPPASKVVGQLSNLGEHAGVWLVMGTAGALLDRAPRRSRWRRGAVVVAATYGVNTAIKHVFKRPRPRLADLPPLVGTPSALSFPSAHASTSFAAAGVYSGLLPAPLLYLAATAMAGSRVYLGVHYPSDVAAGALLGLLIGGVAR
jgi:membrane-associated phospholipid phosphatase